MSRLAAIYHNKNQRIRNLGRGIYAPFIATPLNIGSVAAGNSNPGVFGSEVKILVSGSYGISFDSAITSGELTFILESGRVITTSDLGADEIFRIGWLEADQRWQVESAIAGVANIYWLDNWKRSYKILEATFT